MLIVGDMSRYDKGRDRSQPELGIDGVVAITGIKFIVAAVSDVPH